MLGLVCPTLLTAKLCWPILHVMHVILANVVAVALPALTVAIMFPTIVSAPLVKSAKIVVSAPPVKSVAFICGRNTVAIAASVVVAVVVSPALIVADVVVTLLVKNAMHVTAVAIALT